MPAEERPWSDDDVARTTAAIARGDPEAFTRLYHAWFDRLLAIAKSRGIREESHALDVVQDTMTKVITKMPALSTHAALAAWMNSTTTRACFDSLRATRRRLLREAAAAARNERTSPMNPGQAAEQADEIRAIELALGALSAEDSNLIANRVGRELTYAALADGNATGASVAGRFRRVIARVTELLKGGVDE